MNNIVIALVTGVTGGVVTGATIALLLLRRPEKAPKPRWPYRIDGDLDARITDAAERWASDRGRPEAAPLAANKLRMLARLNQRRMWRRFE